MPNILTTPTDAYPSIPDVGDTLESHTLALQAIRDSLETGERQDGNYLESFVTFQELVTLGIIDSRGEFVLKLADVDIGVLNSLTDVTIASVTDNEVLAYDVGSSEWINQTPSQAGLSATGHTHTESEITDLQTYLLNITGSLLGDLFNVVIEASPQDKEFLVYDLASAGWINQTAAELGISFPGGVANDMLHYSGGQWAATDGALTWDTSKLKIFNAAKTQSGDFYYDTSDFNTDISGTGDNWNITPGSGGRVKIIGGGLQLRVGGLFTIWSPDDTKWIQMSMDNAGEATLSATSIRLLGTVRFEDSGLTDYGDFWHDGTHFQTNFVNTGNWIIRGIGLIDLDDSVVLANSLKVQSVTPGLTLIETDAPTDGKQWTFVAGTNIGWWGTQTDVGAFGEYVINATRTGAAINTITIFGDNIVLNPSAGISLATAVSMDADVKFENELLIKEVATAPVGETAYGVIWVKNTIPNELWFTNDASEDFMLVSDLVGDTTPQLGGNLASNGFDILMADNDKVIFGDGGDMQLYNIGGTATSVIDNLNANAVLEFNFTGGQIKFDGLNDIVDIRDGWKLRIRNSTDTEEADFFYDGDFNTVISGTGDHWLITPGNGGRVKILGPNTGLHLRDGGALTIYSPDDTTWAQLSVDNAGEATLSATSVRLLGTVRFEDSGLTDYGDFWHDGADFQTNFVNTANWVIRGVGLIDLDDSVVLANSLKVQSTTPGLTLIETDAAADAKQWTFVAGSTIGWWGTQTDVGAFGEYVISATRTGAAINAITIHGDSIILSPDNNLVSMIGAVGNTSTLEIGTYATTNASLLKLMGSTANVKAELKCTNGNLHMDANSASAMYLNYYAGTAGIFFGSGATGSNANVTAAGVFTWAGGGSANANTAYGWGNHAGLYAPLASPNFTGFTSFGGDTIGGMESVTGNYGSVQCDGFEGSSGGYAGYSINGRVVFMHNNATVAGIYDDVNSDWLIRFDPNNTGVYLYHNGILKLATLSTGAQVTGKITNASGYAYAQWNTAGQTAGMMTISTAAASGGANGDIHFRY